MWRTMQMIAELAFTGSAKKKLKLFVVVLVMICLLHFFSFFFSFQLPANFSKKLPIIMS